MRSFLRLARRRQGGSRTYTMRLCVSGTQEFLVSCVQVAVIRPRLASSWSANGKLSPRTRSSPVIRLSHQSLDVTLAYLKGKDAESEEAQEHANSSSLALYA